jgi:CelD/BcsL family acetyltransferase involved in cellulose biosynthesis
MLEGRSLTLALEQAAARLGFDARRRYRKAADWMPLPASYADYVAARSSKFRNYARRPEKKLQACGALEVVEITSPQAFPSGFEALLEIERDSWKHTHGTAVSAQPAQSAFYRAWGDEMAAAGKLHLQLLLLDGRPIAHNLGCIHRGTYYYLKTSYSAVYRPQSPATFLRLRLIESMIARRLRSIDFCGTPYEWELQWTSEHRWHHVLSIYAGTWRGRVLARLDRWTHYSATGDNVVHGDPRQERSSD